MKFCGNCGTQVNDNTVMCPQCGKILRQDLYEQQQRQQQRQQQQGNGTGPNPIYASPQNDESRLKATLSEGEVIVRTYHLTNVFFARVKGFLYITNKRIIFNAEGVTSKVFSSTPIDSAGPINAFKGWALNWKQIIFGIIFLFAGITCFSAGSSINIISSISGLYGVIDLAIGGFLIYLGTRKGLFLSIAAKDSGPGLVVGKSNITGLSFYSIQGFTGKDALQVMNEIGAIILDLQKYGDKAIPKWKR